MRISITSEVFDPLARLEIRALPSSQMGELRRRVNRVPTLDLGVAINDRGFSHGDRTFVIRWQLTPATDATARYITQNHSRVRVSTTQGVFEGVLEQYNPEAREGEIRILVTARLGP